MGFTVIIEESKIEEASHMAEKMLHYGGRLMSCLENMRRGGESMHHRMVAPEMEHWQHPHQMQERYRDMNFREHDGYNREHEEMNERRGMPGTGPYGRIYRY